MKYKTKPTRTRRNQEFYREIMRNYKEYEGLTLMQCDDIIRDVLALMREKLLNEGFLDFPGFGTFTLMMNNKPFIFIDWEKTREYLKETGEFIKFTDSFFKVCKVVLNKRIPNSFFYSYIPSKKIKNILYHKLFSNELIKYEQPRRFYDN